MTHTDTLEQPTVAPAQDDAAGPAVETAFSRALAAARGTARRGMTIIEIMVVMGIIAIIGTALAFGAIEIFGGSQEDAAKIQLKTLAKGLDSYYVRHREYPDRLDVLVDMGIIPEEDGNDNGTPDSLEDPWKKEITYSVQGGRSYKLCATGGETEICHERKPKGR